MTRARSLGIIPTDVEVILPTSQPSAPNQALVGTAPANPADPVQLSWLTVGAGGGGGSGTVTSVGLVMPSIFTVTNSPVVGAGNLTAALVSQPANTYFAAPATIAGAPSFRTLVAADFPLSGVTPGTYNSVTVDNKGRVTAGVSNAYGTGTVTSVGLSLPNIFTVSGSPVTTTGSLTAALASQPAATVLAAPVSVSGPPSFRALLGSDIPISAALDVLGSTVGSVLIKASGGWTILPPGTSGQVLSTNGAGAIPSWVAQTGGGGGTGSVTSVGLALPGIFTVSGSPVTSSGTLTAGLASQAQNLFFASPSGAAGTPTFRGLVATDLPDAGVTFAKIQNLNSQRLLGRSTTGAGVSTEVSATQVLDWIGATRGSILYRDTGGWLALPPGTAGQVLQSGGSAANPSWVNDGVSVGDKGDITVTNLGATWTIDNTSVTYAKMQNVSTAQRLLGSSTAAVSPQELSVSAVLDWLSTAQGSVLYRGATGWSALPPGASGQVLQSGGAAANVSWTSPASALKGSINPVTATAPTAPVTGDYYFASATGTVGASWTGISGRTVTSGDMLIWNGTAWDLVQASTPAAGSDTQVQYNDGGVRAGAANMLWSKTTNILSLNGTAAIKLPVGNATTERPANAIGLTRYNNVINSLEINDGAAWHDLARTDNLPIQVWDATTAYPKNDLVELNGRIYRALINVVAGTPVSTTSSWYELGAPATTQALGPANPVADTAPVTPAVGDSYTVSTAGVAGASWTGIAGVTLKPGDQIKWDGTQWSIVQPAIVAGLNTQVLYNDNGVQGAASVLGWDKINNRFGVGTLAPIAALDVVSTGSIRIPVGTTAQQPAGPNVAVGMIRYNSTTNSFEGYSGATPTWAALGGVAPTASIYPFDAAKTYAINDLVTNAGKIYRANAAVAAGAFNAANWTEIGAVQTFTAGSVPFADATGALTQNNASFFWNATGNWLGLGTKTAPTAGIFLTVASDVLVHGMTIGRGSGNLNSNIVFGQSALQANTTGASLVALGLRALTANTTGTNNVAIGGDALSKNNIGTTNIAIGGLSMQNNLGGGNCTAIGAASLQNNLTGNFNLALGAQCMRGNRAGSRNIGIGAYVMDVTDASDNVGIGDRALNTNSGGSNVSIGNGSMQTVNLANNSIAIGQSAYTPTNSAASATTTVNGSNYVIASVGTTDFVAIGAASNTVGLSFTATGPGTGTGTVTRPVSGTKNICIGVRSGFNLYTGSNNVILGGHTGEDNITSNVIFADGAGTEKARFNQAGSFILKGKTTAAIKALASPLKGAIEFSIDANTLCFFDGTAWQKVTTTAL